MTRTRKPAAVPDRLPPHSVEAERGVLGCCLLDPGMAVGECQERLRGGPETFYDLAHRLLYEQLTRMFGANQHIDIITLTEALRRNGQLEAVGGLAYVSSLADETPSASNVGYYIEILREQHLLRRLIGVCGRAQASALDAAGKSVDEILDSSEAEFMRLNEQRTSAREVKVNSLVGDAMDKIEGYRRGGPQMAGLPTGFGYLDKMLCGLGPGDMIVIGARPGEGKTSLAMNIVEHVAIEKKIPCGVFTMEMINPALISRLLFQYGRADYQRFRTGFMENSDVEKFTQIAEKVGLAPIWLDDSPGINVMELRARARRMQRQYGIKCFVIDYLQLMRSHRRYEKRYEEVAEASRGIKALAKELAAPIVVCAQLNREMEKDPYRKPRLSDLRECGDIEADADVVALLYPPKLNAEEKEIAERALGGDWSKKMRRMNLLIAKQRNGPTGDVELVFHKACMRFEEYHRNETRVPDVENQDEMDV